MSAAHSKKWTEWTRKEFEGVEPRKDWQESIICRALVLLPTRRIHDSGYSIINCVAIGKDGPICKVGLHSDVLFLDNRETSGSWGVDCLKKSRLICVYMFDYMIEVGCDLSTLTIKGKQRDAK